MNSVTSFIEGKLKLKVNLNKSAVDRPWKRKFLGFSFTFHKEPKVRIAKESVKRMKNKIREITSRKKPYPMEYRIKKLNNISWVVRLLCIGRYAECIGHFDSWIRRRLRMCIWKDWKLPRTKVRKLIGLGVPRGKAYEWGNSRKGYWRISAVRYYIELSETPTGVPKGSKVCYLVMKLCVTHLN